MLWMNGVLYCGTGTKLIWFHTTFQSEEYAEEKFKTKKRVGLLTRFNNIHECRYSCTSSLICKSSNCLSSIVLGASSITSLPELFFGKAIKSRMLSVPPRIAHKRSKP